MTLTTDDLVKVEHPGSLDVYADNEGQISYEFNNQLYPLYLYRLDYGVRNILRITTEFSASNSTSDCSEDLLGNAISYSWINGDPAILFESGVWGCADDAPDLSELSSFIFNRDPDDEFMETIIDWEGKRADGFEEIGIPDGENVSVWTTWYDRGGDEDFYPYIGTSPETNNEFYESIYQVDIDGNGSIPQPLESQKPEPVYTFPATTNSIAGTNKKNKLKGTRSNDSILGLGGNDKLNGKKGNDILEGGDGNDSLKGAKGDDYLLGSKGDDVLIGGRGADVFKTSKGVDIVRDFSLNQGDRIGLNQDTVYDVIDDVDGTLIRVSDDIRMLLLDQDYDKFLAAGNDTIARIAV